MGFLKVFGLEKEKNEIGSYKYDKGLQILEDLDEYCIGGSHFFVKKEANNIFDIEIGIKIGKYEIGGATLSDFYRDLRFGTYNSIFLDDHLKHIFWIRNSETDEIKAYSNYDAHIRVFYDEKKDELFTYDEKGRDNLYLGLLNVKHYYARNYSTIDGFKYLDDDMKIPLSEYKLDEIFSCNFKELQAVGTWSNQNDYNTMLKDKEKFEKIKQMIKEHQAAKNEAEYLKREAEKKERKKRERREELKNNIFFRFFMRKK